MKEVTSLGQAYASGKVFMLAFKVWESCCSWAGRWGVHLVFCTCSTCRGLIWFLALSHVASAVFEEWIPAVGLKGTQESSGSARAAFSGKAWFPKYLVPVLLWFHRWFLTVSDLFCGVPDSGFIYLLAEVCSAVLWSLQTRGHRWHFKKSIPILFHRIDWQLILIDNLKKVTFI